MSPQALFWPLNMLFIVTISNMVNVFVKVNIDCVFEIYKEGISSFSEPAKHIKGNRPSEVSFCCFSCFCFVFFSQYKTG